MGRFMRSVVSMFLAVIALSGGVAIARQQQDAAKELLGAWQADATGSAIGSRRASLLLRKLVIFHEATLFS